MRGTPVALIAMKKAAGNRAGGFFWVNDEWSCQTADTSLTFSMATG
jgi:hypothetical protein